MCVWTKKRGSMNAVVLMATPCPKSLHGKGEKWIAHNMLLEGETENTGVCTKERKGVAAEAERRWVLLKIPRCDIDGVGEGK